MRLPDFKINEVYNYRIIIDSVIPGEMEQSLEYGLEIPGRELIILSDMNKGHTVSFIYIGHDANNLRYQYKCVYSDFQNSKY
jgi:hypothetical protein